MDYKIVKCEMWHDKKTGYWCVRNANSKGQTVGVVIEVYEKKDAEALKAEFTDRFELE